MKLLDKIVFTSFIITLLFIASVFLLMLFVILFPEIHSLILSNREIISTITIPFYLIILFFWGYCVWFFYKYDRYSGSLLPLFLLGYFYAAYYYYNVKIKKRPLLNKNGELENNTKTERNLIDENDFEELTRESIIGILELWSSKVEQIKFQESQADINVTEELLQQWEDLFIIDSKEMRQSFTNQEFKLLVQFDKLIHDNYEKLNQNFIKLNDFVETDEWKELNLSATKILKELNKK
jgi:hypothetical protein